GAWLRRGEDRHQLAQAGATARFESIQGVPAFAGMTNKELPRRHRLLAAIVVEAAIALAAEPTGLDIFYQQRARAVFRIGEAFVQHLHDRQAGIEADEI